MDLKYERHSGCLRNDADLMPVCEWPPPLPLYLSLTSAESSKSYVVACRNFSRAGLQTPVLSLNRSERAVRSKCGTRYGFLTSRWISPVLCVCPPWWVTRDGVWLPEAEESRELSTLLSLLLYCTLEMSVNAQVTWLHVFMYHKHFRLQRDKSPVNRSPGRAGWPIRHYWLSPSITRLLNGS